MFIISVWQQPYTVKKKKKSTALLSPLRLGLQIVFCAHLCSQRQNSKHASLTVDMNYNYILYKLVLYIFICSEIMRKMLTKISKVKIIQIQND